jgi:hypothetical protein
MAARATLGEQLRDLDKRLCDQGRTTVHFRLICREVARARFLAERCFWSSLAE